MHHNHLKLCEDQLVPIWLHQLRHKIVGLDITTAYDEAEQELNVESPVVLLQNPAETIEGTFVKSDKDSEGEVTESIGSLAPVDEKVSPWTGLSNLPSPG